MNDTHKANEETYSKVETEVRREATLKQLLATPPKPRKRTKKGISRPKRK